MAVVNAGGGEKLSWENLADSRLITHNIPLGNNLKKLFPF